MMNRKGFTFAQIAGILLVIFGLVMVIILFSGLIVDTGEQAREVTNISTDLNIANDVKLEAACKLTHGSTATCLVVGTGTDVDKCNGPNDEIKSPSSLCGETKVCCIKASP